MPFVLPVAWGAREHVQSARVGFELSLQDLLSQTYLVLLAHRTLHAVPMSTFFKAVAPQQFEQLVEQQHMPPCVWLPTERKAVVAMLKQEARKLKLSLTTSQAPGGVSQRKGVGHMSEPVDVLLSRSYTMISMKINQQKAYEEGICVFQDDSLYVTEDMFFMAMPGPPLGLIMGRMSVCRRSIVSQRLNKHGVSCSKPGEGSLTPPFV